MTDKRIYISPELHARIKALSDRYGIPIQTLTSMAFEEWLAVVERDGIYASR